MRVLFHSISKVIKPGKTSFRIAFYILLSLLLVNYSANGQRAKIDSLKKALPALHDSALVDYLNVLSLAYTYLQTDSAKSYGQKAYSESSSINYLQGVIMALNNKAHIAGLAFHNFPLQEKICLQTIQLYKSEKNTKALTETYKNLALAFFCQSYFDSSAEACTTVIRLSQKTGDKKSGGEAIAIMGSISFERGDYEKSFEYFNQSLKIFKSNNDSYNTAIVLAKIGDLYRLAGDNKTALNLYSQSLDYKKSISFEWYPLADLGDTYYSLEPYDSTLYDQEKYLQTIKSMTIKSNYTTLPRIRTAEIYIASKEYDKALALLTEDLKLSEKNNDKNQLMRLLLNTGNAYEGKRDYERSFNYTKRLLQIAQSRQAKQYIRDAYKLTSDLYGHMHKADSAYYYYRQYTSMKEYVALDEFSKKLAIYKAATENEKKQAQIELLSKEKLIGQQQLQLSGQQLKSESLLKNILSAGVLVLVLLGFIIFRNIMLKRKNEAHRHAQVENELTLQKLASERAKIETQQKAAELEMQALRAQMNPHFIFNCLNSINRFIIANKAEMAANHLTKFAKLIRLVLQQSGRSFIPLEDELFCLQLYMDLEALRFEIPFRYEIHTHEIDTSAIMIPSLLLQPFVENAIWHGLQANREAQGNITIDMSMQNSILHCKIMDNGIGRAKAGLLTEKKENDKTSLGIKLTEHRLQLLDASNNEGVGVAISDIINKTGNIAGTCVDIKIPVKEI
jgi:tetratricopeptide (TPR) repeat protein